MVKKSQTRTIIFLGLAVLTVLYFTGNLGFTFGEPDSCEATPNDFRCFCGIGEIKQQASENTWACEDIPAFQSVDFPIETFEEGISYVESLMGGFDCSGEFFYEQPLTGDMPITCNQFGFVGKTFPNTYAGHIMEFTCLSVTETDDQNRPIKGEIVWDVRIDPNDGYVYKLTCDPTKVNCPNNTFRFTPKPNVTAIIGDGCCHNGENNDNSPNDCPIQEEPVFDGEFCTKGEFNLYLDTIMGKNRQDVESEIIAFCVNTPKHFISDLRPPRTKDMTGCSIELASGGSRMQWKVDYDINTEVVIGGTYGRSNTNALGVCFGGFQ